MAAFDYASRDFDTIKQDLLARATRVMPEWTDRDPSDFGMLLVDLWASAADVLHYYIDRAAGEAMLPTAQQRESVLALANLLDYVPRGRTSAIGTVTLTNTALTATTIAPLTEFIARHDNNTFQLYTEAGGVIPGSGPGNITIHEGALTVNEVLTVAANGQMGQRYTLSAVNVVDKSVRVNVLEDGLNPVTYQHVSRITSSATGDRVFATNVTADGDTEVIFGTSLNGFVPPSGARITTTYASSSGSTGNLPANSVTSFKSNTPDGLSVTSSSSLSGGIDEESIASLKKSIPSVISAQNRGVTRNDFVSLALQVDGVAKAAVSYEPSLAGASAGNASVTIYPQPQRGDYLTTIDVAQTVSAEMQTAIETTIQPRALLGVEVFCAPTVDWQGIDINTTVYVNEKSVANWVRRDVERAIDELFEFDNVFFGQRLTLGQLYRIILNTSGVDYCTIETFDTAGGVDLETSILINELKLPKKGGINVTVIGGISTT